MLMLENDLETWISDQQQLGFYNHKIQNILVVVYIKENYKVISNTHILEELLWLSQRIRLSGISLLGAEKCIRSKV